MALEDGLFSAQQSQQIDQYLIQGIKIPSLSLMAKAAFACFCALEKQRPKHVVIVTGMGNNAGDGFMVATLAHMAGIKTSIYSCVPLVKLAGDAAYMYHHAQSLGVQMYQVEDSLTFHKDIAQADVIVDAIFGTGLNRDIEGVFKKAIEAINSHYRFVISVDIPSGICATTGRKFAIAVKANITVTFICQKMGLYSGVGPDYVGDIIFACLVDSGALSLNDRYQPLAFLLTKNDLQHFLPLYKYHQSINKSDKGHVGIIAGDKGMAGAAIMAAKAALTVGAGRVTLFTHPAHAALINVKCPEVMCYGVDDLTDYQTLIEKLDVLAIGCGSVKGQPWSDKVIKKALTLDKISIVDAGALDYLTKGMVRSARLITPHEGEAARLLHIAAPDVKNDRLKALQQLGDDYQVSVLLKGCGSLIYDQKNVYLCKAGDPILATAGSGDLLTGIIAGLCAQNKSLKKATLLAVLLQGIAAEDYVEAIGKYGFCATKLLPFVVDVLNQSDR
ncbi:NAD(P)H-hydrate dehydratase [Facilibium subflavum]|uniref:NAD(P)H-hydrate dehydratase n=1 Tax=Facilibium subflavum TaxID=2219058 RepID=UPI000E65E1A2|nr:NAD(P)H-hydrate dehydratase [Facilibium subflavum]